MNLVFHSKIKNIIKELRLTRVLPLVGLFLLMSGNEMAGQDFTLVVIPDPQYYASSYPEVYNSQTQWIADNKTSSNIVFATAVGDLVNTSSISSEYIVARNAFDRLDTGNVPYSVSPGNHDMDVNTLYEDYFGVTRFTGKTWYGGHYGSNNFNNFSLFSASGMNYIIINLQYSPGTTQLDWADSLLKTNSSRRAIVVQHDILNFDDTWVNQASYTALKDNPNLFLMLCGHRYNNGSDGAAYRAEQGDDGHTIHIVMADYQGYTERGYLRILRFSPMNNMIFMTTYSPYIKASITTLPDQMEMVYNMKAGTPTAYNVTGGGSYCQGTGGLPAGLANSEPGVTYTLYKGAVAQTAAVIGNGAAISFGNQTAGTYTVSGTTGGGTTTMTGSAVITENPTPAAPAATPTQPAFAGATGTITVAAPTGTGMTYSIGGAYQSSALFSAVASGTYTVTAKNSVGCISSGTIVTINDYLTGSDDIGVNPKFEIFPVPNDGQFTVVMNTQTEKYFDIVIHNSLGSKIYEEKNIIVKNKIEHKINMARAPAGMYYIMLRSKYEKVIRRIIILK
jgi:hypothetical protein